MTNLARCCAIALSCRFPCFVHRRRHTSTRRQGTQAESSSADKAKQWVNLALQVSAM